MNILLNGWLLHSNSMSTSTIEERTNARVTSVIHEIYDGVNNQQRFEYELECALEAKVDYIVIEPTKLGEETSRWIRVGNCIHKTAVISGLVSLVVPYVLPEATPVIPYLLPDLTLPPLIYIGVPTTLLSIGCASLYGISWQFDPCCKYQVTVNSRELSQLNVQNLTNASPVVLVRKDDKYRKVLHNCVAAVSGLMIIRAIHQLLSS